MNSQKSIQHAQNVPQPFDDRDGVIWYNGALVNWRDANVHVLNHGLHYASSVFEGVRVYNGKIFKLTEHSKRLRESAELLGFEIPYNVQELDDATQQVVEAQNIVNGYIRPIAWRGSEQMAILTTFSKIHVAIATWQWPSYYSEEAKLQGLKLTIADWQKPAPNTAPSASKAAGLYMVNTLSKNAAEAAGYQDALMLDWRGYIAEATGANMFLVMNDTEIHTPTPDCFLDGITRRTVIDLAKKRDIEVVERHIELEELANAKEVFLTGTAAEVTPVKSIAEYEFTVGNVTKTLMQDYKDLVNS